MEDHTADETPEQPGQSGSDRDRIAEKRDRLSVKVDDLADARDLRAQRRDDRAEIREQIAEAVDPQASLDRAAARRDRQESADERMGSLNDRVASDTDRVLSARERAEYLVDELTGAHRRVAGLFELEREVVRARRTNDTYTLAFIDVDGLKAVNDIHGHDAGDELLVLVADTIRNHIRPYDLLIRYGGDEFLCGLLGLDIAGVEGRFEMVNAELAVGGGTSATAGIAELLEDEPLADLIRRADDNLYERRKQRGTSRRS
jgi:diguanylate cyclase (GGDEF)-like protein